MLYDCSSFVGLDFLSQDQKVNFIIHQRFEMDGHVWTSAVGESLLLTRCLAVSTSSLQDRMLRGGSKTAIRRLVVSSPSSLCIA